MADEAGGKRLLIDDPNMLERILFDDEGSIEPGDATFLASINALDAEIGEDLAVIGFNIESPFDNEAAQLQAFVDRLLASAKEDSDFLAASTEAEKLEIAMVKSAYARSAGPIKRRLEYTLAFARTFAPALNYGSRKSLELAHGSIGRTDHKVDRVDILDENAAFAWAEQNRRDLIGNKTVEYLDKVTLKEYAKNSGEDLPFVKVTPAHTEWWARPSKPPAPGEVRPVGVYIPDGEQLPE